MTAVSRVYSQARVDAIFAKAEAAAADRAADHSIENWDAYMLSYVATLLNVEVHRPTAVVTQ